MKKVFITILAIVYIVTSAGATIHLHYCMGELANWGLKHDDSKKCGICGSEKVNKENSFCKIQKKFLKNNSDQKLTNLSLKRIQIAVVTIPISFINSTDVNFRSIIEENPINQAPLRQNGRVTVYILNCVFLI